MTVRRLEFDRVPYIGAFALSTDRAAIFPQRLHFRQEAAEALKVPLVRGNVSRSPLLGILVAGNSKGLVCPDVFQLDGDGVEDLKVGYVSGKLTALGNLVLANDRGALVSPEFSEGTIEVLRATLDVPIERGTIAGYGNVGAVGAATNKGALLHPDVTDMEAEVVRRTLGVEVDVGTACGGVKFVGLCVVANSNGALAGATSTGPELGRIESALGFL